MVPQSFPISGTATMSGFLVSRFGRYKWTLVVGPLVGVFGVWGLSTIDRDTTAWGLAPHLVLLGFGMGLAFPNMTIAVQNAVEMSDLGVATSTSNFFRNMGSTFGAAIMGALLNAKLDRALQARVPASADWKYRSVCRAGGSGYDTRWGIAAGRAERATSLASDDRAGNHKWTVRP